MREILFKAKRIDNGEWVVGFLFETEENTYIAYNGQFDDDLLLSPKNIFIPVEKKTICQYTGLTDKNDNKIWENDIVEYRDYTDEQYVVAWETSKAMFEHQQYGCSIMNFDELSGMEVEAIGNIFDNPELIGGVQLMSDLDIEIALLYLDDMDKYHTCNEYKTIKQSLEKQMPKKPIWIKRSIAQFQVCPSCSD